MEGAGKTEGPTTTKGERRKWIRGREGEGREEEGICRTNVKLFPTPLSPFPKITLLLLLLLLCNSSVTNDRRFAFTSDRTVQQNNAATAAAETCLISNKRSNNITSTALNNIQLYTTRTRETWTNTFDTPENKQ